MMMNRAISNLVVATVIVGACGDGGGSMATDTATTSTSTTSPTSTTGSASQTGSTGGAVSDGDTVATTQAPTSTTTGNTTTESTGAVSATDTDATSTGDISTGTTDPGTSTGPAPDLGGPCGGPGEPDVSYIWIANSEQGTISKINTQTLVEEGRYIVRPDQAGSPSRTSVSLTGDVAVANRYGGLTKVYARPESCVESNGMPGIQTSTDSNFLPWGVEECIAWYTPMDYISQRPVAWTQGTFNQNSCLWENHKVWTTGANEMIGVDVLLVNGTTGVVEAMKHLPDVASTEKFFGMYGAAVDKDGNLWASQLGQGTLLFVDIDTLDHKTWPMPAHGYGMTVGASGYVWTCAWPQVGRFDPMTETWQVMEVGGSGGCMEDDNGTLYMSGGNNDIVAVDVDTLQVKANYPLPEYVHGISVDYYGYVWGVSQGSRAYRVDVMNGGVFDTFTGLVGAYTYSDMTGVALKNVTPPM